MRKGGKGTVALGEIDCLNGGIGQFEVRPLVDHLSEEIQDGIPDELLQGPDEGILRVREKDHFLLFPPPEHRTIAVGFVEILHFYAV